MSVIHIFTRSAEYTTARYFERAIQANGDDYIYYSGHCPVPNVLVKDDVFLFVDPAPDWPIGIETSPCLKIAYLIDVHQDVQSRLRLASFFDVIFIAQKDYVSIFENAGHKYVYWLPLACDPYVHKVKAVGEIFEVGFVGKLDRRGTRRNEILTTVLPRYKTNDYSRYYYPRDMSMVYGQSKIVLNVSINGDLNMRFFEAMASGALLVTDSIKNGLDDLFEEGVHYVGYLKIEDAIEKIDYYLINDVQRKRIAENGQKLVIEQHTYQHRWQEIWRLSASTRGQALVNNYSKLELSELYSSIFVDLRKPWRIPAVICRYGFSKVLALNFVKGWGRWLNARIPLTPNAIRRKFGLKCSNKQ